MASRPDNDTVGGFEEPGEDAEPAVSWLTAPSTMYGLLMKASVASSLTSTVNSGCETMLDIISSRNTMPGRRDEMDR